MSILDTGPKQSESQSSGRTVEQAKIMKQLANLYMPMIGQGQPVYGGERVAGMTPLQQSAISTGGGLLGSFGAGGMPMYSETGTALSKMLSGEGGAEPIGLDAANDYFRKIYVEPAREEWAKTTAPAIQENFAGPGYWSSARANAMSEGAQNVQNWLGQQRAQFDWDVLQNNQALKEAQAGRMLSAVPQGLAYGQAPTQDALAKLSGATGVAQLSAQEQAQKQAEIGAAMQRWAEQNRKTDPEVLDILMGLINKGVTTSSGDSWYSPTEWPQMISGWGALIGGLGA